MAHRTRAPNIQWGYEFYQELGEFFTGAYVNYIDPLLPGWAKAYYGDHYDRLLEVKKHWDPTSFLPLPTRYRIPIRTEDHHAARSEPAQPDHHRPIAEVRRPSRLNRQGE